MINLKRLALVCTVLTFAATSVYAAGQGNIGTDSTGTSTITITTDENIQITNVGDLDFSNYPGTWGTAATSVVLPDDVCIWTNDTNTRYKVTASGGANGYVLANGGSTIPYTVEWFAAASTAGDATALTSGTTNWAPGTGATTGFTGATNAFPCVTDNASYRVTMLQTDINDVPANTYTGTLTIIVMPDNN